MADLIDRRVAIEKFEPWLKVKGYSEGELNMLKAVLFELTVMPSAQPEAKTPTWKEEDRFVKGHFTWYPCCPKCDHELVTGQCYCEICGQHIDWSEDDE